MEPLPFPRHSVPSSWQRPPDCLFFLAFLFFFFSPPHAFPESRYVDSIRLTSHNGEFVQQGEPHYPNPSVALPLFEISAPDWRGLPSVSFRWDKRWIQALPLRFTRPDSSLLMAGLTPAPPKRLHQSAVSLPPSRAARATFSFLRLRRETNWTTLTEWLKSMRLNLCRLSHSYPLLYYFNHRRSRLLHSTWGCSTGVYLLWVM